MKSKKIIFVIGLLTNLIIGQKLWDITAPEKYFNDYSLKNIKGEKTVEKLKSAILMDDKEDYRNTYDKYAAIYFLTYYHYNDEKTFIDSVFKAIEDSITNSINSKEFSRYCLGYSDPFYFAVMELKGFLGQREAINGMINIADSTNSPEAISYLAMNNIFNYCDNVIEEFRTSKFGEQNLILYGNNPAYHNKITDFLTNFIDSLPSVRDRALYCHTLYSIDRNAALNRLNQYFNESVGNLKREIFISMYLYDPQNQPNRIISGVKLEPDDVKASLFIPTFDLVNKGSYSEYFIKPFFIHFLDSLVKYSDKKALKFNAKWFLEEFYIPKPDSTHSLQYLMDDFQNYLEEVNNYGWINESAKYEEYKTQLEYAETKIVNNEIEECRMKLEEFKIGIQNDFDNGLITNEAYRYLFFYPDYLIERLPDGVLSVPR